MDPGGSEVGNLSQSLVAEDFVHKFPRGTPGLGVISHLATTYREIVRVIAAIDVVYALLLLGLHLLGLITGGRASSASSGSSYHYYPNGTLDLGPSSTSFSSYSTTTIPPTETIIELQLPSPIDPDPRVTTKERETIGVYIWITMFAGCILQLLVAGALYGGTSQRDGRVCIRNSRIWSYASMFFIFCITSHLLGLFLYGLASHHLFAVSVYSLELIFRLLGLILIRRYIREVKFEMCDLDPDETIVFYELRRTPNSTPTKFLGGHPV